MTATLDVNQRLFDQRRAAIDSGNVTRRDDGVYVYADKAEVFGREGLDMSTGEAALYTAVPAWHGLGEVIPGGTSDIDEVLRLGRIDWEVDKRAVRYGWDGDLRTMDDRWVTVRSDNGDALGTVGRKYQVIQNRELFIFLEDLVATHGVIWESAGALRDGRKTFITMRVPEHIVIDRGGLDDEIVLFIAAMNSHDGSSGAQVVVTPWRIVCANTERFAVKDARSRWGISHTKNALQRIEQARTTLGLTVQYGEKFAAEETALARTNIAIDEFHKVIDELWPVDEDAKVRTINAAARRTERLDAMFRSETERAGRTAYAAERSITDYLDHVAPKRPGQSMTEEIARATALLEGTDDEIKTRAHKRLMTLVQR